jgi:hypothetical protein
MTRDETIRKRDQARTRNLILTLGDSVKSRTHRVELQYLQAQETSGLLTFISDQEYGFGSAVLFRFGLDTLATGFWIACKASDKWLSGEEGEPHIPSDITGIISDLPTQARDMFQQVIDVRIRFADATHGTLLKDILNPATHGDALVSANRMGSESAQGRNWARYMSGMMKLLTHNFVILIRELTGIDPSRGEFDLVTPPHQRCLLGDFTSQT